MRARAKKILVCALLGACTVSNTGNPNTGDPPGGGEAPAGIELLRSKLERDPTPDVSSADAQRLGSDQRAFAGALYGQLAGEEGNLFFSPYSVATALAMTYAGAKGETKRELAAALRFTLAEPALHAAFNAADLGLQSRHAALAMNAQGSGFRLDTTNAIFAHEGLEVERPFLDTLALHYDSGLFIADFAGAPERERKTINDWVHERTEQRIVELLPQGSIDALTAMVLVNTIYFKGSWLYTFDAKDTRQAPFHAPSGDVQVAMMQRTLDLRLARGVDHVAVELPYLSDAVRMLLVLPDQGQFAEVERRVASGLFDEARGALEMLNRQVRLPRFSFRSEYQLSEALRALGVELAFGAEADFSGIAGAPGDLFIDNVYHQAFLAVDEQGTEAAASTAVVITRRSVPEVVTFDRPFMFFIYDEPTGQILFCGRLIQPE